MPNKKNKPIVINGNEITEIALFVASKAPNEFGDKMHMVTMYAPTRFFIDNNTLHFEVDGDAAQKIVRLQSKLVEQEFFKHEYT